MADGSFEVVLLEEAREYVFSLTLQAQKKIYYNIQKVSGGVKDVVATHGFAKKRWGVPHKEIAKAEELRRKYYESKD